MKILMIFYVLFTITSTKIIWIGDIGVNGARYPIYNIYDGNTSNTHKGQINSVGMRQQYLLGTYLRSDYIYQQQVIDGVYNPNSIEAFACIGIDATYDSAVSRLYGLFPTGTGWRIPKQVSRDKLQPPYQSNNKIRQNLKTIDDEQFALNLGYQPIPIWPLDNVLNDPCPNIEILKNKRLAQIEDQLNTFQIQNSQLIAKAILVFNLSTSQQDIQSMAHLYDTLISDLTLGKTLPEQWTSSDMKNLKYINEYYTMLLNGGNYAKIFSILLMSTLKQKMESVLKIDIDSDYRKWSMFIARQNVLAPMLTVLNLSSPECIKQRWQNKTITQLNCVQVPKFSSNIIMQLHQDNLFNFIIRIRYNGYYVMLCQKQLIDCQYRDFWERIYMDVDRYRQECYGNYQKLMDLL